MDPEDKDGDFKIGDIYSISMNKKIGSGAFGDIYRGKNYIFIRRL